MHVSNPCAQCQWSYSPPGQFSPAEAAGTGENLCLFWGPLFTISAFRFRTQSIDGGCWAASPALPPAPSRTWSDCNRKETSEPANRQLQAHCTNSLEQKGKPAPVVAGLLQMLDGCTQLHARAACPWWFPGALSVSRCFLKTQEKLSMNI